MNIYEIEAFITDVRTRLMKKNLPSKDSFIYKLLCGQDEILIFQYTPF